MSGKIASPQGEALPHRVEPPLMVLRLRRVEDWRRARLQRLLADLSVRDREKRIRAARLYLEVGARRMALERGLIK
ncbi:hypothetical protein HAP47_0000295 [Bradyrhizobium sp. 41S5]|uniref:hypothetical protein n=1 Tax=Bradyrhizobium sp. 41S5 TaxID=1404443 RepID=UPI00156B8AE3|nr:hypothetical protein [Bradyrhizobium sp. 41S5]UFX45218.1 hypothetical protein HAP47_0000295 [Bradyrhizobium sp. 41S5]